MTKSDIKKYYKNIAYLNLAFGVLFVLIFTDIEIIERIQTAILINICYHMFYLYLSNIHRGLNWLKKNNYKISFNGNKIMMGLFSYMTMIFSIIIACFFISNSFSENEYYMLFALFIPVGLFLGGYTLMLNLKEI